MKYHLFNRVKECDPLKRGINWSFSEGSWRHWRISVSFHHRILTTTFFVGRYWRAGFQTGFYRDIGGWELPYGSYTADGVWVLSNNEEAHDYARNAIKEAKLKDKTL